MTRWIPATLLAFALSLPTVASAQEAPDALQACVLESATEADHRTLVRWIYAAIALHPDLQDMAGAVDAQREQANREMGALIERLLAVDCVDAARQAAQAGEADAVFGQAFGLLGQVAGQSLFNDSRVGAEAAGIVRYVDMNRIVPLFLP